MPILLTLGISILGLSNGAVATPNEPETYSRLNLSVGGYYYSGNLNQVQGNFQGHYGLSSPTKGVDVLFNGYRLWSKADENAQYKRVGDDAFVTGLPFWYFSDRFYLAGLARYESSRIQKLNYRYLSGAGIGFTPVRSKLFLIRASIIPAYEYAGFGGDDFRIDVPHDGPQRQVLRAAMITNGWYRVENSPITLRYFAQLYPNPQKIEDFRANVTGNIDVKLTKSIAFRTTLNVNHDAAILSGREPTDVRSVFGLAFSVQ